MATLVELPKLGNTVEECLLTRWVRRKGDTVSEGEVVLEIETDKTNFEITAPVAGTVLETFFEEGALVPVFAKLCVIGDVGERVEALRLDESAAMSPTQMDVPNERGARDKGQGAIDPHPFPLNPPQAKPAVWSPRARRYAAEHNVQMAAITGSGPGGRVLEEDVRRAYEEHRAGVKEGQGAIARSGIRDTIARRMRESLASTAQYTMHASANATALLTLRTRLKSSTNLPGININDLVAFCTIKALVDTPDMNAQYIDGKIVTHSDVSLGFACDTPRGLMVPVVRNADRMPLGELATSMKDLAARAIQGILSPDQLTGATFTISNLGALGIESFTPLINPPQVAILGVGAIELKPIRRNGNIEFVDVIRLSLTCDHQVIDGAPGARFLRVVAQKIEHVDSLIQI